MARKKPCSICRRWFEPDARTAKWQRSCGRPDCQRVRHANACKAWRARNPDYDVDRRFRGQVVAGPAPSPAPASDPRQGLRWPVARDAMGLKATIVLEELAGLLVQWIRDAMASKPSLERQQDDRLPPSAGRDEIGDRGPSP